MAQRNLRLVARALNALSAESRSTRWCGGGARSPRRDRCSSSRGCSRIPFSRPAGRAARRRAPGGVAAGVPGRRSDARGDGAMATAAGLCAVRVRVRRQRRLLRPDAPERRAPRSRAPSASWPARRPHRPQPRRALRARDGSAGAGSRLARDFARCRSTRSDRYQRAHARRRGGGPARAGADAADARGAVLHHGVPCGFARDYARSFPSDQVRLTSIYSKQDGVVRWQGAVVPEAECVEVTGSHVGLAVNRQAYRAIAQALARPELEG